LSAAHLVFPVDEACFLRRDLFVLAPARCRHAKALFALTAEVCELTEGLLSFTECGCQVSEVLCSTTTVLWLLAKNLYRVSEELVPPPTGLPQRAEDRVSLAKGLREKTMGLREEPKDLHQKGNGVSSLAEGICQDSRVLVQGTTILFRLKKGHAVFSKFGASFRAPRRLESESLFFELERLCGQGAARFATNLVPSHSLSG
jgi:hypothetical protein